MKTAKNDNFYNSDAWNFVFRGFDWVEPFSLNDGRIMKALNGL